MVSYWGELNDQDTRSQQSRHYLYTRGVREQNRKQAITIESNQETYVSKMYKNKTEEGIGGLREKINQMDLVLSPLNVFAIDSVVAWTC